MHTKEQNPFVKGTKPIFANSCVTMTRNPVLTAQPCEQVYMSFMQTNKTTLCTMTCNPVHMMLNHVSRVVRPSAHQFPFHLRQRCTRPRSLSSLLSALAQAPGYQHLLPEKPHQLLCEGDDRTLNSHLKSRLLHVRSTRAANRTRWRD